MNIKINVIGLCMKEEPELFDNLTEILKNSTFSTFNKIEICEIIFIQNVRKLQEEINFTKLTSTNIILIINLLFLDLKSMKTELDKIRNAKNKIIEEFTKIPLLLKPENSRFLHCSYKNQIFIFCITGDKNNILKMVEETANTMISAAYLLQQVSTKCNIFNHPYEEDLPSSCKRLRLLSETQRIEMSSNIPKSIDVLQMDKIDTDKPKKVKFAKDAALKLIKDIVSQNQSIETEEVDIKDAFGRILFEAAKCRSSVPPFTAATKDGYAIIEKKKDKDEDEVDANLIMSSKITSSNETVAKWVNKGDCIPNGTTTVISAEKIDNTKMLIKASLHKIIQGQNIKLLGSEIKKDKVIVSARKRIGSTEIAFLTACGYDKVRVLKNLSIAILTIGNKLQEPAESLKSAHSYDSNRTILISLLKENCFNFCTCLDFGIVEKNSTLIEQKIVEALKHADLLVTTGCLSDKDCLKDILKNHFKARLYFENVNIKPGKSTVFASSNFEDKIKYILCLPTNPVSVFITAHLFLLPLIKRMHNIPYVKPMIVMALTNQTLLLHSRPRYMCATISWSVESDIATVTCKEQNSISNKLFDIKNANALLQLPAKTLEADTLTPPAFVPALLIKFPTSDVRHATNMLLQI